jgi:hypothetical protein
LGATATILATQDVRSEIESKGLGPIDITIECSGAEPAIKTAIRVYSLSAFSDRKRQQRLVEWLFLLD